jgi:hypothetical protein
VGCFWVFRELRFGQKGGVTEEVRSSRSSRRLWRVAWVLVLVLVVARAGWRAYDHRAAEREALALEWEWRSDEPWERIRQNWRAAFEKSTWVRNAVLWIGTTESLAQHGRLIQRLNPTQLTIEESADLPPLRGLSRLKRLEIRGVEALPDLNGLQDLPRLELLHLRDCETLRDLGALRRFTTLRELRILDCRSVRGLQGVSDLPVLESLHVTGSAFEDLSDLQRLPKLREVTILGCPSLRSLGGLGGLAELEFLSLTLCPALETLDGLVGLPRLANLRIDRCRNLASVKGLQGLPSLGELAISGCSQALDAGSWPELPNLRVLHLQDFQDLEDLEMLTGLEHLQTFTFRNCPGLEKFTAVEKMPQGAQLSFSGCPKFSREVWLKLAQKRPDLKITVWKEPRWVLKPQDLPGSE